MYPDPEVKGAATTAVRRKNAEAEKVFKPVREGFSPEGEDVAMTQNRTTRPESKPGRQRSPEEASSKPEAQPEEGDWEERRSVTQSETK
ncbi:hypothetical protein NDU88_005940 [Pleurodeles waltl]|uniref:Uncharacterized protein n=1 Tax=Pleurodeles waltl TaxID=8319 RepID=A0AAV7VNC8_PLEWA|nr:hypothetical protein NDU88_005940 [Pleurodeles waltl]